MAKPYSELLATDTYGRLHRLQRKDLPYLPEGWIVLREPLLYANGYLLEVFNIVGEWDANQRKNRERERT